MNVPQTKMRHPVRLNPHPLHSPRLCSPVEKEGYRRREGYGREIWRGGKGEERFKEMDKGGDACRESEGKDSVSGGKVKNMDYENNLRHLTG